MYILNVIQHEKNSGGDLSLYPPHNYGIAFEYILCLLVSFRQHSVEYRIMITIILQIIDFFSSSVQNAHTCANSDWPKYSVIANGADSRRHSFVMTLATSDASAVNYNNRFG